MTSRTKSFAKNSLAQVALQLVTLISGFVVPRVMLVYFGSEINGLVTSISQFISYFNLLEAGLSSAAVYALYRPIADEDHDAISSVVSATRIMYIQSGWFFIVLTIICASVYPLYIQVSYMNYWEVFALVLILGANGGLEFFALGKYKALLIAHQKLYAVSIANIAYYILNTLIVIVAAYLGAGIVLLRLIAVSSIVLRTIILYIYCKREYPYINYKATPNRTALNKRWDAFFLQILGIIQTSAPIIILTILLKDLAAISVFAIYNLVISGVSNLVRIFSNGLYASFGDVIARDEQDVLKKAYSEFELSYYIIITIAFSVTAAMILPFVSVYTRGITDVNYYLPLTAILFSINGLMYNMKSPQGMLVLSAGLFKETKIQASIQAAIIVIVGSLLVIPFGINGVIIGSICSNLYRTIDLSIFIPKHVTKLPIKNTIRRLIAVTIDFIIIALPYYAFLWSTDNYFSWALMTLIYLIFATLVTLTSFFLFERKTLKDISIRLKHLLNRK